MSLSSRFGALRFHVYGKAFRFFKWLLKVWLFYCLKHEIRYLKVLIKEHVICRNITINLDELEKIAVSATGQLICHDGVLEESRYVQEDVLDDLRQDSAIKKIVALIAATDAIFMKDICYNDEKFEKIISFALECDESIGNVDYKTIGEGVAFAKKETKNLKKIINKVHKARLGEEMQKVLPKVTFDFGLVASLLVLASAVLYANVYMYWNSYYSYFGLDCGRYFELADYWVIDSSILLHAIGSAFYIFAGGVAGNYGHSRREVEQNVGGIDWVAGRKAEDKVFYVSVVFFFAATAASLFFEVPYAMEPTKLTLFVSIMYILINFDIQKYFSYPDRVFMVATVVIMLSMTMQLGAFQAARNANMVYDNTGTVELIGTTPAYDIALDSEEIIVTRVIDRKVMHKSKKINRSSVLAYDFARFFGFPLILLATAIVFTYLKKRGQKVGKLEQQSV